MKSIICQLGFVVILMTVVVLVQAADKKEMAEKAKQLAEECVKETGISPDETKLIMANESKQIDEKKFTDKMKCYMLCFYKKVGILDANNKHNLTVLTAFMEARYNTKKDKIKPAITSCGSIKEANHCEHVFKFERCIVTAIEG
ncbi:general odorant-binding protein 19d-like [Musca autumnalis]|uniref:general odorant-binding protein 19d-like n=1 Tax=Musca autumnalis TaxID=221902 RepID=UPI003CFB279F